MGLNDSLLKKSALTNPILSSACILLRQKSLQFFSLFSEPLEYFISVIFIGKLQLSHRLIQMKKNNFLFLFTCFLLLSTSVIAQKKIVFVLPIMEEIGPASARHVKEGF